MVAKDKPSITDDKQRWEQETLAASLAKAPERKEHFATSSDIEVERLYTPDTSDNVPYPNLTGTATVGSDKDANNEVSSRSLPSSSYQSQMSAFSADNPRNAFASFFSHPPSVIQEDDNSHW